MVIFFSLYLPILLSISLSFLLHAFNKHIHFFMGLVFVRSLKLARDMTNTIANYEIQTKCHHPIPCTTAVAAAANIVPLPSLPPPTGLIDNVGSKIGGLATCTESLGFESFEIENDDGETILINNRDDDDEKEEDCWKNKEGGSSEFPPPLSSLDGNGQQNFVLLPVRKDGRLQLSMVRVKRPETLCATREDGRLRLYLIPDEEGNVDDDDVEQEDEFEEEIEEETEEEETVVEEEVVEMISIYSEEEEEDDDDDDDRVRDWEFPGASASGNEWFMRCHQVVHHIQYHHHVHSSHLHNVYGVGIA